VQIGRSVLFQQRYFGEIDFDAGGAAHGDLERIVAQDLKAQGFGLGL